MPGPSSSPPPPPPPAAAATPGAHTAPSAPADATGARLEALEIRVAYQDDTIDALNTAVIGLRAEIDRLQREHARLAAHVDNLAEPARGAPADEVPPHY